MLRLRHASVLAALLIATASCTSTVVVDTYEMDQKLAALQARVETLEKQNLAAELDQLKALVTKGPRLNEARMEQLVTRKVEQAIRQAKQQPRATPEVSQPITRRAGEDARARRTLPGGAEAAAARSARRAEQIGKRVGLAEAQTTQLATLLQTHQERLAGAMRSAKEAKTPKDEVRERIQVVRQANEAELGEFTATLTEEQRAKFEQAMGSRREMMEKARKGGGDRAPAARGNMERFKERGNRDKAGKGKREEKPKGDEAAEDDATQY